MDGVLTDDQIAIRDSVQSYLTRTAGLEALRAVLESKDGWDRNCWTGLSRDLGICAIMIPEEFGGLGLGATAMALVLEETGSRLVSAPVFECGVMAATTILATGSDSQKHALLPGLADGSLTIIPAVVGATGVAGTTGLTASLTGDQDGSFRLNGDSGFVTFAASADLFLIAARQSDGSVSLVALPADSDGLTIEALNGLDPTRPFARLRFDDVAVAADRLLGGSACVADALDRSLAISVGLLAAEQTGGAAFCLSSTVEYAAQRVQFGRTIGSFQAVKHELADMVSRIEAGRSAALTSAAMIDAWLSGQAGEDELLAATSGAAAWCAETYRFCAGQAIQLHGGIGFTWEHQAHLYFKRAWFTSQWLGDPASHRERVARAIGLDAA